MGPKWPAMPTEPLRIELNMIMQELPMEQMNLGNGGVDPTHLERLANMKEEVGMEVKWEAADTKPFAGQRLMSPAHHIGQTRLTSPEKGKSGHGQPISPRGPHLYPHQIRPEDYEDEARAKSALENGVNGDRGYLEHPSHLEHPGHLADHPSHAPHLGHPDHPGHPGHPDHPNHPDHPSHLEHPGHLEDEHIYPPYAPTQGGSPYHEGEPSTPHHEHMHSFSPDQLIHQNGNIVGGGKGPPINPNSNGVSKKSSSRRNAWGNLSYADLITNAINSSPEKRLTLSQVYDWMVQNIDYFKDKGDSNSSAGWKNSIRHNLSLHNKFVRVQNEGTGKSSWWMINLEAKSGGKSSRRRASNQQPDGKGGYDSKRRGRSKKSLDMLRNGQESTPSPNGLVDGFPDSPLHPGYPFAHDMRVRTGSNASEFGRIPSPLRGPHPEFFGGAEGGWPPEQYNMVPYGHPNFRPPGYPGEEMDPAMMERMGMDPRLSPHSLPPHLRPNYLAQGGPGHFPPGHPFNEHPHYQSLQAMSPHPQASLSPVPEHPQPATPVSAHEPLMSPHHLNNGQPGSVFFAGSGPPPQSSCALSSSSASPDSPAPGSSSSILERALAKQEPPSPLSQHEQQQQHPGHPGHPHHPDHPMHHHGGHPAEWTQQVGTNFGDINMDEYIGRADLRGPDFGMEGIAEQFYPGGPPTSQEGVEGHSQYPHPQAPGWGLAR